jgi:hypothetical protein
VTVRWLSHVASGACVASTASDSSAPFSIRHGLE